MFSNFALSFSIICILAGGVTSFHLGFCSVGGASIGFGWPLVVLFALAVAATMGQLASAFPTAGGLYHWAALLGGRGWGWVTAWLNLAGLVTVLAAINVGTYRFAIGSFSSHGLFSELDLPAQALGVILITATQAMINHLGIGVTARLTDFSGYWILLVTAVLTTSLLAFAPGLDFSRLVTFENFSGTAGGNVWPAALGMELLFAQGLLLPAYTITGFDASAHAAEETIRAAHNVPRGILRSVLVSGVAGWILLGVVVLAAPAMPEAAARGEQAFLGILTGVLPRPLVEVSGRGDCHRPVPVRPGHVDLSVKNGVCIRARRRPSLVTVCSMDLPKAAHAPGCDLERCAGFRCVHTLYTGLRDHHGRLHDFPLSLVCDTVCSGSTCPWKKLDHHGPVGSWRLVSALGDREYLGLRRLDRDWNATAESEIDLGCWRLRARAGDCLVYARAPSIPCSAAHQT